jgi:DNA adenine methylase
MAVTVICDFCGNDEKESELERDAYNRGYWCGSCDAYNYLNSLDGKHQFTLFLEDKHKRNTLYPEISMSFKKQLSVLRYPGGKSKFIPFIYSKLQANQSRTLVSPFAGGASAELALLHAGAIDELILNDLDVGIYSLFWTIKHTPDELIQRIMDYVPTHKDYFRVQVIIKNDYLGCTITEAAWYMLIVNRLAFSGIYSANTLGGRKGSKADLTSRWNPKDLCKRIRLIHGMSERITVYNQDACDLIELEYWRPQTTLFIDPPYVQKGKQLYRCYYDQQEHIRLCVLLDSLHQGMPGADIILCYDNDPFIESIYEYPTIEKVNRVYSV